MRAGERGMSLVEALVGLVLLTGGMLVLSTLVVTARSVAADARREAVAMWLARSKLAQLQALTFVTVRLPSGGTVTMTDVATDLSTDPPGLGGPGLTPSPADALRRDCPGYVDYLDPSGVPLPETRRGEATWVRRWAIGRQGTGASETVTFEVVVATRVVAAVAGTDLPAHTEAVRLVAVQARRAS